MKNRLAARSILLSILASNWPLPSTVFITVAVLLFPLAAPPSIAQNTFIVQPSSRFWIDGTSNVNHFTCTSEEMDGKGVIQTQGVSEVSLTTSNTNHKNRVEISIPVRGFDCGKKRMNADLYDALQASSFPVIFYRLSDASLLTVPDQPNGWYLLQTSGVLTIAGSERKLDLIAEGRLISDGIFQVRGEADVRMTDFGVRPPTALLGVVRANDQIKIRFDVVAACELLIAEGKKKGLSNWQDLAQADLGRPCDAVVATK